MCSFKNQEIVCIKFWFDGRELWTWSLMYDVTSLRINPMQPHRPCVQCLPSVDSAHLYIPTLGGAQSHTPCPLLPCRSERHPTPVSWRYQRWRLLPSLTSSRRSRSPPWTVPLVLRRRRATVAMPRAWKDATMRIPLPLGRMGMRFHVLGPWRCWRASSTCPRWAVF